MKVFLSHPIFLLFPHLLSHTSCLASDSWVFGAAYGYQHLYARWTLAQKVPHIGERTHILCYEDLLNPERDILAIKDTLHFFFNGTSYIPQWTWPGTASTDPGKQCTIVLVGCTAPFFYLLLNVLCLIILLLSLTQGGMPLQRTLSRKNG